MPSFIEATGIGLLRETYYEKEESKKTKQKGRERVRPKMDKLDINYEILRESFFKCQTKPRMTKIGEIYYEGKEYELLEKNWRPTYISDRLREALGMEKGSHIPPPWLINMQRYGPPSSYPGLKIPGLNVPIPTGCRFGYGPGEWGKPNVNLNCRMLYGDSFDIKEELNKDITEKSHINFEWGKIKEINIDNQTKQENEIEQSTDGLHSTITSISSQIPRDSYAVDAIEPHQDYSKSETSTTRNLKE